MTKIGISGFLDNIPNNMDAHRRGWMEVCRKRLEHLFGGVTVQVLDGEEVHEKWLDYDRVFFHHGLYWYGKDSSYSVNAYGGMSDMMAGRWFKRFTVLKEILLKTPPETQLSLEYHWPKRLFYKVKRRLTLGGMGSHPLVGLVTEIEEMFAKASYGDKYDLWSQNRLYDPAMGVVIGDSHVGASWLPGQIALRNDRETLHGVLKRNLLTKIRDGLGITGSAPHLRELTFHYGNIDVRHHLCRQPDPRESARILAENYLAQVIEAADGLGVRGKTQQLTIVEPYPIENESRPVIKSVFYEGQPFWGTWKERSDIRDYLSDLLDLGCAKNGINYHRWPEEFRNEKRELKFEVMEWPRSIHLSPRFYRWDFMKERENQYESIRKPDYGFMSEFFS